MASRKKAEEKMTKDDKWSVGPLERPNLEPIARELYGQSPLQPFMTAFLRQQGWLTVRIRNELYKVLDELNNEDLFMVMVGTRVGAAAVPDKIKMLLHALGNLAFNTLQERDPLEARRTLNKLREMVKPVTEAAGLAAREAFKEEGDRDDRKGGED
jgi:hypothetical protein